MGSSSSSMSGLDSRRHSATRRFSPPDSLPTMASQGGRRSVGGDFHLVLDVVGAAGGGGGDDGFKLGLLGGQRVEIGVRLGVGRIDLVQALPVTTAPRPSSTAWRTVLGVELRFLRQVADVQARHGDGFAFDLAVHARQIFSSVDLPEPFRPSTPILAPGKRKGDIAQDLPLRRHDLADAVHGVDVLGHGLVSDMRL